MWGPAAEAGREIWEGGKLRRLINVKAIEVSASGNLQASQTWMHNKHRQVPEDLINNANMLQICKFSCDALKGGKA